MSREIVINPESRYLIDKQKAEIENNPLLKKFFTPPDLETEVDEGLLNFFKCLWPAQFPYYQMKIVDVSYHRIVLQSNKCPYLGLADDKAFDQDAYCWQHSLWWKTLIEYNRDVLPRNLVFQFTEDMGHGCEHCTWVMELIDRDRVSTQEELCKE